MSEAVKQYPAWQQAFREAQAERQQEIAMNAAIERDKKADAQRKVGRDLAKALMHFGIYLEAAPETNLATIDGFDFCLSSGAQYHAGKNSAGKECVQFTLRVSKLIPNRSEEDGQLCYRHISVNTAYDFERGWDKYLAEIADAFDGIDYEVAEAVQWDNYRREEAEERRLNRPEKAESTEEKLLKLIRSIVRDEIANQIEY